MKARLPRALGSLRSQLLRWLIFPLAVLVAIDAFSVYNNALNAADLAYDRSLLASTRALAERVSIVNGKVVANVPYLALDSFETDTLGRLYYKVTGINGEFVSGFDDLPPLPANVPRSDIYPALVRFYHATYRNEPVRIAALYQPVYDDSMRGIVLILVGESMEARRYLSRKILVDTLARQAALVIAAAMLIWFAVRFVLRPVLRLKNVVEARLPIDLNNFEVDSVHKEMQPLVTAMNGYMARLRDLISVQRRFMADASHQLRTPLTVLKTQTEMALRENDPDAMRSIVESIARTTDATVHLANRLLTLARAEHGAIEGEMAPVSLVETLRQVALELAQNAVRKNIELSFEAGKETDVTGNALLLHEMLANLVDNAIVYTPTNGKLSLRIDDLKIEIEDNGPGISPADRERVFAPFYRSPTAQAINPRGAGLGLSIVRDIANLHGADIMLGEGAAGRGLKVVLRFPGAAHV
jgi:two-component system sensor histidine kinase TctE